MSIKSKAKAIIGVAFNAVIFGGLLFAPAGTLKWWRAWVFLGVVVTASIITMATVFQDSEELLNERFKPPIQSGQPLADRIILIAFVASFFLLIGFIPLDVFHWHLLGGPPAIIAALGLAVFLAGWWLIALALSANTFAAPVVRHQEERHQVVVERGAYRVVRHPMYAGGILIMAGMPLWLESWAATLFAILPITLMAIRIVFEEQFLRRKLQGYDNYAAHVRYRLIPFVW
ncbi:MAG: isoprenylcysteine carboxylmethyltransferase family protein [Candidatus Binataceae bacterium]